PPGPPPGASVRALGIENEMARANHPIKWGTMVYGAGGKNGFYVPVMGRRDDGTLFEQTTWQVRRSDFDEMLLNVAKERDIPILKGSAKSVDTEDGRITAVRVEADSEGEIDVHCQAFVDASGQSTFLSKLGLVGQRDTGNYNRQIAVYGHFSGAIRPDEDEEDEVRRDDTIIFYREKYHWAWFIPLDDEIVSIGVVTPIDYFKSKNKTKEQHLLDEIKEINPMLASRVKDVTLHDIARSTSNYSYHIKDFVGPNYLCVGDAHRFIDPIFSLGLHFSMAEGRKAGAAIADAIMDIRSGISSVPSPLLTYQSECENGQEIIQTMLDAFWDFPLAFSLYLKDKRYRDNFIDMFAGRVYDTAPSKGLLELRRLNAQVAQTA
ncbi:MAG TPA: hypothetical protein DCZ12_11750, partial [Gammaproteobacteria bacterium]|nr:hypothetical protein [Gammaproteobacteria bacterium]